MQQTNGNSAQPSSGKRDSTFVMVRRGLLRLEHWAALSGNAAKLFVWLLGEAHWSGQKRGWVETTFEDMARANGWSYSTAQRTVKELESKPYIKIERSTNQHKLTRIQILKYDIGEHGSDSAPVKSDHSNLVGPVKIDHSTESAPVSAPVTGPVNGAVKSDRSNPASPQNQQDLQAPKKLRSKEIKKEASRYAVRRPFDAEQRVASLKDFSLSEKRERLAERIATAIHRNGNELDRELDDHEREAFRYIEYEKYLLVYLADGFVTVVGELYEDHKDNLPLPGILCSKIIDRCMSEQKALKTLGMDPSDYYWPPDFQRHRDNLRRRERVAEQNGGRA